ncbi:MAG: polysaccharide biosynthesis C-terminal domain-containing protein, partial [Lachnospiraceae bacterium]|nr:polysaccharide biosynthesis C-terminal domain-containing protein [Lachnospiraceae bacterium]
PANLLYNFCAAMMRSVGDTKRPMIFLLIACIVNVGLDILFVLVIPLGVTGVALGTALSQTLAAALSVISMFRDQGALKLEWKSLKLYPKKLGTILKIGIPAGIQSAVFSLSNVVIQSAINGFGKAAVAGMGAGYQIEIFVYEAVYGFYHTSINFVGQNVGAKRYDRIKKGLLVNLVTVSVVCIVLGGGSYLFGDYLLRLYTDSPEAIRYGMIRLLIVVMPYILLGFMEVISGAVRGLGASITPMLVSLIGCCLLRVVWVMTVFKANPTMETLMWEYPVTWTVAIIGHTISFFIFYARMKKRLENPSLPRRRRRSSLDEL